LLAAMASSATGATAEVFSALGMAAASDVAALEALAPDGAGASPPSILQQLGRDLTALARDGKLSPVVGRDGVVKRLLITPGRETKPNAMLVGEAGVGKTAVVEGLALRVASGKVPEEFAKLRIVSIESSSIVAGASLVGSMEQRLRGVIEEAKRDGVVLFFDEI